MTEYITLSALNALEVFNAKEIFNKQRRTTIFGGIFNIDNSMHWKNTPQKYTYWQKMHYFALNSPNQNDYYNKFYYIKPEEEIHIKLTEM